MADFNIRSDAVDVEQIMRQIRARIREKRGVDYTEDEIRQLAGVKLEKFLEPSGVRSDLIEQFRRRRPDPTPPLNYAFEDDTIYASHRAPLRWMRRLLSPVLKLFFNPNPMIHVLHLQAQINERFYTRNQKREQLDPLYFEVMHNLVLEMTRLGIEVKNLKMRVESLSGRMDFDERRAHALEGAVQYKPGVDTPLVATTGPAAESEEGSGSEERRRRRRRRRRRGGRQAGDLATAPADGRAGGAETPNSANEAPSGTPDEPFADSSDDKDAQDQ